MSGLATLALLLAAPQMDHAAMGHGAPAPAPAQDHAGHDMAAPAPEAADIPQGAPPAVPRDHAADAFYDPAAVARARKAMEQESGGMIFSRWMLDRAEYRAGEGRDGYHWEGEGWVGGDLNRFAIKTEGEGRFGERAEQAEVQALYWRALDPWFNLEAGVRQDLQRGGRTYAVVGVDGLAPYWFEVSAQAFLSDRGDVSARLEASYDQRITQRLILQPAVEVNLAAQDVPDALVGAGLTNVEAGLRLRYEFAREFAPYIGVNREKSFGRTARFLRAEGEGVSATTFVAGVRMWF
ncbi:copper resistance protein B [Sphingomonas adhaesiva]|uniref:copper resistance protein B n=1 Tax=Sphingomonas adhaesiva TaxID=28212 RepID=UPI002FF8C5A5